MQNAVLIDCSGKYFFTVLFDFRYRFTINHGFINIRFAADNIPIDRYFFTGLYQKQVIDFNVGY